MFPRFVTFNSTLLVSPVLTTEGASIFQINSLIDATNIVTVSLTDICSALNSTVNSGSSPGSAVVGIITVQVTAFTSPLEIWPGDTQSPNIPGSSCKVTDGSQIVSAKF